jgi:GNAT superfamily N-acetyltransferase
MHVSTLSVPDLQAALTDLARLRIAVFRDYPYLYDGALDYEAAYLSRFASARDAIIVAAREGDAIVGCATGSALDETHADFAAPLAAAGINPASTFYFGESVLLPAYRGKGIGHAFFDQREAHARAAGYKRACFCAVIRPDGHPMKPAGYSPLDAFWTGRRYSRLPGAITHFPWTDIGESTSSPKPMQVWLRSF